MKVLVTGCAGFIGYHVAAKLIKQNYRIIGIDNLNNYYDKKLKIYRLNELRKISNKKNFNFFQIDICHKKKLKKLFKKHKFRKILHFAAPKALQTQ